MKPIRKLSRNIFLALILGSLVGIFLPGLVGYVSFLGLIFKLSLSMIVMPIVVTSILAAFESIGNISNLSNLGVKSISYYISTTFIAVILGLILVTIIEPGVSKPSKSMQQKITNLSQTDLQKLALDITETVALETHQSLDSVKMQDFHKTLEQIAKNNSSVDDLKQKSFKLIGSLELRSKLAKDSKPTDKSNLSIKDFLLLQIEKTLINPFEALASKNVLAIIIFTMLFGAALTTIGPLKEQIFQINKAVNLSIMKIIHMIMYFCPFGVFGLIAEVTSSLGLEVFSRLGLYIICVLLGLFIHLFIILPIIIYTTSKTSPRQFFKAIRPALMVAFSTSSSSATLPINLQCVEDNLKIDKRISKFVLPLGSTINMDGTALYEAVAAVFIAQLFGVSLDFQSQVIVALTAALASMGAAGIPAAGTVTMSMVLAAVGLPIEGIGIILAVDRPLDMCRTAVNVASDATACVVINSLEK